MKVKVILEPSEDGGFTTTVPALPGCISEGDTREDALRNIREAVELYEGEFGKVLAGVPKRKPMPGDEV